MLLRFLLLPFLYFRQLTLPLSLMSDHYVSYLTDQAVIKDPRVGLAILQSQRTLAMWHISILHLTGVFLPKILIRIDERHLEGGVTVRQNDLALDTVLPRVNSLAFHLIVYPLCPAPVTIGPPDRARTVGLVPFKVPNALVSPIYVISRKRELPFAMELVVEEESFVAFTVRAFQQSPALADMLTYVFTEMPLAGVVCLVLAITVDFSHGLSLLLLYRAVLGNCLVRGVKEGLIVELDALLEPLDAEPDGTGGAANLTRREIRESVWETDGSIGAILL